MHGRAGVDDTTSYAFVKRQFNAKPPESVPMLILIPKSKTIQQGSIIGGMPCANIEVLNDFHELKGIVHEYETTLILAVCDAEYQDVQFLKKAVEASRELLLPIEVFLDSAPHDSFHILFDNMFAVQRDSDALIFTPKPDKTKNGSIYRRSGTPCGQIVQSR